MKPIERKYTLGIGEEQDAAQIGDLHQNENYIIQIARITRTHRNRVILKMILEKLSPIRNDRGMSNRFSRCHNIDGHRVDRKK